MPELRGTDGTPRERVIAEARRRGVPALVQGCVLLLDGRADEVDDELILVLGSDHGQNVLDGYNGGKSGYWPRVWAARGLLHVWAPEATAAIIDATTDEAWRVREMACKVVARHEVGEALSAVAALQDDPVPRVRSAAGRALEILTERSA